jgi:hypothetical protein
VEIAILEKGSFSPWSLVILERCVTVEMGNFENGVLPLRLVSCKKGGWHGRAR